LHGNREIDGIEVGLALKATRQVRARVHGRVVLAATRAEESQLIIALLMWPI
jgi:hypothetical protein